VFVVTFSEPVFGFGPEDVTLGGTAAATTATIANPSGDKKTYQVTVTGAMRSGTIELLVPANGATDAAGNPNLAAELNNAVVTFRFPTTLVGAKEFAVGADAGGGAARLYNPNLTERFTLPPFGPDYAGGVRVAAGDFNGDGVADLVTGSGPGGPSHVRIFDGANQQDLFSIDPFEASFTGGVYVAAGDLNGNGKADIITGAGEGGGPHVKVFDFANDNLKANGYLDASFFAFDPGFKGGARVAAIDRTDDGKSEILVVGGKDGRSLVNTYSNSTFGLVNQFYVFAPTYSGGTNIG